MICVTMCFVKLSGVFWTMGLSTMVARQGNSIVIFVLLSLLSQTTILSFQESSLNKRVYEFKKLEPILAGWKKYQESLSHTGCDSEFVSASKQNKHQASADRRRQFYRWKDSFVGCEFDRVSNKLLGVTGINPRYYFNLQGPTGRLTIARLHFSSEPEYKTICASFQRDGASGWAATGLVMIPGFGYPWQLQEIEHAITIREWVESDKGLRFSFTVDQSRIPQGKFGYSVAGGSITVGEAPYYCILEAHIDIRSKVASISEKEFRLALKKRMLFDESGKPLPEDYPFDESFWANSEMTSQTEAYWTYENVRNIPYVKTVRYVEPPGQVSGVETGTLTVLEWKFDKPDKKVFLISNYGYPEPPEKNRWSIWGYGSIVGVVLAILCSVALWMRSRQAKVKVGTSRR